MKKRLIVIVLTTLFIISGCSLIPISVVEAMLVSFEYKGTSTQAKRAIMSNLRAEYLISDEENGLCFYTNSYKAKRKGFLPWGPVWEERIKVSLKFFENEKTLIVFKTEVQERQGDGFEWIEKNSDASDPLIEKQLARRIELIARGEK